MRLRKWWLVLLMVMMLLLDWAALDDITTGNEPNYIGEYGVLVVSGLVMAYLVWKWWKGKRSG